MQSYRQKINECIEYLNSIRFPCEDWKEDKKFYDRLEQEFVQKPDDDETRKLWRELNVLIYEKRVQSLNMNKTTEELYAGWDD